MSVILSQLHPVLLCRSYTLSTSNPPFFFRCKICLNFHWWCWTVFGFYKFCEIFIWSFWICYIAFCFLINTSTCFQRISILQCVCTMHKLAEYIQFAQRHSASNMNITTSTTFMKSCMGFSNNHIRNTIFFFKTYPSM